MDMSALLGTLLSGNSVQSLSQASGASTQDVQNVLSAALPSLLQGALGQAQNEQTASGFASALQSHAQSDTSDLGSFLNGVDLQDGGKILMHLLGANTNQTAQQVSAASGVSAKSTVKILAMLAPLLMNLLGKQTQSSSNSGSSVGSLMNTLMGSGNITSILGSLLGGKVPSVSSAKPQSSGLDLMSVLMGLMK